MCVELNFNLCGKICDACNITLFQSFSTKTQSVKSKDTLKILHDINDLLVQPDFELEDIYDHMLNKFVQITKSEYGFLATIGNDDVNIHSSTNVPPTDEVNELVEEIVQTKRTVFHTRDHIMGVYSRIGDVIVVVCNKPTKYTKKDSEAIGDVLKSMCYLFLGK
jgi:hypothetical protein